VEEAWKAERHGRRRRKRSGSRKRKRNGGQRKGHGGVLEATAQGELLSFLFLGWN